ncbi:MAG: HNH endonuclease [Nannocystis sp.]|nr:HNH endonuclease [Nannocystis sp.]
MPPPARGEAGPCPGTPRPSPASDALLDLETPPEHDPGHVLVVQRVGQGLFRDGLLELWEGRCAVTGLAVPALLRASHIKPWAGCESDAERFDVHNGLLLAPQLDAAFDRGFITVQDDGAITVSAPLNEEARAILCLEHPLRVHGVTEGHRSYLPWHRQRVFRGTGP